jgi:hypothetical protein
MRVRMWREFFPTRLVLSLHLDVSISSQCPAEHSLLRGLGAMSAAPGMCKDLTCGLVILMEMERGMRAAAAVL